MITFIMKNKGIGVNYAVCHKNYRRSARQEK